MTSQADLHVHSKFSNNPGDFYIRLLGSAESYTEPVQVYDRARAAGMDFVTISDHDCIRGALEIADRPGTFLSTEVTASFPEDGCKIHCLVSGITERQFAEIDRLRRNIYDFRDYLEREDIIHSVAHPLFQVNDQMTVDHVEKLLLLFQRFEAVNGARHPRAAEMVQAIWCSLTPEAIEEMEQRQGLPARSTRAWEKIFTGGSDDHGGDFIASAYTRTPPAATVAEFLEHLRAGRHEPGGTHGSSLQLAHSFLAIARLHYPHRFLKDDPSRTDMLDWLIAKLLDDLPPAERTWLDGIKTLAMPLLRFRSGRTFEAMEAALIGRLSRTIDERDEVKSRDRQGVVSSQSPGPLPDGRGSQRASEREQKTFRTAVRVSRRVGAMCVNDLAETVGRGRFLECLRSLPLAAASAVTHWPYVAAFKTQHKDERFLQAVADHFPAARHLKLRSDKKLWVTDTVDDVNGVARTVQAVAAVARRRGRHLTLATCLDQPPKLAARVQNFTPVSRFPLPEYPEVVLSVPNLIELMEYIEREEFSEVIISTPGPLGLAARMAGRWLGLTVSGIYHTDFPRYVRHFTGHARLEQWAWTSMRWFYQTLDTVYVPSRYYMQTLTENGFDPRRMKHMPRGVELEQFSPRHRLTGFWQRFGLGAGFQFLYVGRVSKEKNVERLLEAFSILLGEGIEANLAVVGDGPQRSDLEAKYRHPRIAFTGYLHGDDLSRAYASADAFVFPSTTDTFGNVILEAHASGLPAIVSDKGGPSEIVDDGRSGYVVPVAPIEPLVRAMRDLADDPESARLMGQFGRELAGRCSWDAIFDILWREPTATAVVPRPQGAATTGS